MKVLVVGTSAPGALELSYFNAIKRTHVNTRFFDYQI